MLKVNYLFGCPNCGGPIDDERLSAGLPCEKCLPGTSKNLDYRTIYDLLVKNSTLQGYAEYYYHIEAYEELVNLFTKKIGNEPWNLQRYWMKRLVKNESFSLSAPTGLGKTTTLLIYSIYFGGTSLYVVPTNSLKDQIYERLKKYGAKVVIDSLKEDYINVTTFNRILKHIEDYVNLKPKLVIVDDSDMILKSGKTTEVMAKILGIPDNIFQDTISLIKLRKYYSLNKDDEEIKRKILELEYKISNWRNITQFLVASATLKPKGIKQQALRTLVAFEPSTIQTYLRNIADFYYDSLNIKEIISELRDSGGLILVSKEYGKEKMKEIKNEVEELGYKTSLAIAGRKFMDKFREGEVDYLIGSASYYGVAVRGLDEPKRLKYVIFYGIPKIRLKLNDALNNPSVIFRIAEKIGYDIKDVRRKFVFLSPSEVQILKIGLKKDEKLTGKLEELREELKKIKENITDYLKENKVEKVVTENFLVSRINSAYYVYIPDITTYIQASGRSSRIYNNGLTFGVSVVLVDLPDLLNIFLQKLRRNIVNLSFKNFEEANIKELKDQVIKSREESSSSFNIKTTLLVVESPTKAKTIAKIFGRPSKREVFGIPVYETIIVIGNEILVTNIVATKGHVTDLTTEKIGFHGVSIGDEIIANYSPIYKCYSCGRTFTHHSTQCPYCGSTFISSSEKIVSAIRKISSEVNEVYIATDPDQEGEKIAFDVQKLISPYNKNIYRIKYHEVTRNGIIKAIVEKGKVDEDLVKSQIVRRIEDRWIGFELSSALQSIFVDRNQGVGRVQGPVLGWIVSRTREYKEKLGWIVNIKIGDYVLKKYFKSKQEAEEFIKDLKVEVVKIGERKETVNPYPPFVTDSLLIEAYNLYGINASITMRIAQELFEAGLITYHRTDSTHVSSFGISIAKEYLSNKGLQEQFEGRSWGEEGTHEAIRPTTSMDLEGLIKDLEENPSKYFIKFTKLHFKIYDLIFRRFIASQMKPAVITYGKYEIKINGEKFEIEVPIKVEGGFSIIYPVRTYNISNSYVYYLKRGSTVSLFGYGDIIRMMKEKEIGRPSTYAKTISNLIRHGYVVESKKRALLIATTKGIKAYDYLYKYCSSLISEERTRLLLDKIDKVANGSIKAESVISDLYSELHGVSERLVNSLELNANV